MSTATTYLHPLSRASRTLTIRLQEMERRPERERDGEWWKEYVQTADVLVRIMTAIEAPAPPISRRELASRFGRKAQDGGS